MNEIAGWVWAENVTKLLQYLSSYTGTRWDEADQSALDGLLPGTDAETGDGWLVYPIAGQPPLLVHLAHDVGTDLVQVRVQGDLTDILSARFDTLIDVL
jgi:hypothetical protein